MKNSNEHYYEAYYQVWRNGCNPDRVNCDESDDDYYNEREPEYTANREIKRQNYEKEYRK